jgi:hypothetical protein
MSSCPYCGIPAEDECQICGLATRLEFIPLEGPPTDENFYRSKRWVATAAELKNIDPLLAYLTPREPDYADY